LFTSGYQTKEFYLLYRPFIWGHKSELKNIGKRDYKFFRVLNIIQKTGACLKKIKAPMLIWKFTLNHPRDNNAEYD